MSDGAAKKVSTFDERLRNGAPLMECLIEPPFKLEVTVTGVQIDAPCLQFNETDSLGVLRMTFSPAAARHLRDVLNQLEFADIPGMGTSTLQ